MSYSCRTKTVLLFVLVIAIFVILYADSPLFNSSKNNQTRDINNIDKFMNLLMLNMPSNGGTTKVPNKILTDYSKLFTPESRSKLSETAKKASEINIAKNSLISGKLNELDTNINTTFTGINKKLYEQLGKNYSRSQQINNIRQDWLSNIDELPYKVLS